MSRKVAITLIAAALLSVIETAANAAEIKSNPQKFINPDGTTQRTSARSRTNILKATSDTQQGLERFMF
jgi:hypothetical protein